MADITISDLELAPALTDDMVLPVENTTDTYAATLAMLRRLLNKTFVEVENADFNALTDDGFYQCTGTPENSPVAGAINWTLQVSAENGVVVQRAFSLDDNFANLYIRRLNGVTWTAWLEVGAGALANKSNISLSNLDATGQAKLDAKANTSASNFTSTGKQNIVGWGMPDYTAGVTYSLGSDFSVDGFIWVQVSGGSAGAINDVSYAIRSNGFNLCYVRFACQYYDRKTTLYAVQKGQSFVRLSGGVQEEQFIFFPCKGSK